MLANGGSLEVHSKPRAAILGKEVKLRLTEVKKGRFIGPFDVLRCEQGVDLRKNAKLRGGRRAGGAGLGDRRVIVRSGEIRRVDGGGGRVAVDLDAAGDRGFVTIVYADEIAIEMNWKEARRLIASLETAASEAESFEEMKDACGEIIDD